MKYTKLGKTGLNVSTISFGAWAIGGKDWGKTNDDVSKKALHAALDKGVNLIDTADVYGFGHSEKLIREVLDERGNKDNVIIATKAGNDFYNIKDKDNSGFSSSEPNYSKDYLIFAAEQSLKRLNVDSLDILQLHSPSLEILNRDEPWEALALLKEQGKIKHAGLSILSFKESEQSILLDKHKDILEVIQVRYNFLEREAEKMLFPKALEHNIGVIVRIPILFGLLTGKFNRQSHFGEGDHRRMNLSPEKLDQYLSELEKHENFYSNHSEYSKTQINLRFCISHPACHTAIPGGKSPEQVEENVGASEMEFLTYDKFPKLS